MPQLPITIAGDRLASVWAMAVGLIVALTLVVPSAHAAAVASHFRVALTTPPQLGDLGAVARHDAYVVLQPWEAQEARTLEAANPRLVVLVYQNFSAMTQVAGPHALHSSGVAYGQANPGHPRWFLTSPTGRRIREAGFPFLWLANIGNIGYQRQWARNVVRLLVRGPWDGVFMDNVDADPRFDAGPFHIASYPTAAAYQRAVRSMLAYVGPRIRAAGKLSIANMGEWVTHPGVVAKWLHYVDGGMDEKFVKFSSAPGQGYRSPGQWLDQVREIRTAGAMGKRFLAVTAASAPDTRAQLYGWASVLLGADGRTSYLAAAAYTGRVVSLAAYGVALGRPAGRMTEVASGAWERRFAKGLVVVNPASSPVKVSFRIPLSGTGLSRARSATLAPDTALVLTRAGAAHGHSIPLPIGIGVPAGILAALGGLALWRRRLSGGGV